MADTAVLDAVTAATELTPPGEALPETEAQVTAPETEATETPETASLWADKSPEEIDAEVTRRIQGEVAKARESERRTHEARQREADEKRQAEAYEARKTQAATRRTRGLLNDVVSEIHRYAKAAADAAEYKGIPQADIPRLGQIVESLAGDIFVEQHSLIKTAVEKLVGSQFPDYRPSQEMTKELTAAEASLDGNKMTDALWRMVTEAATEKGRSESSADFDKRVAEKVAAELKAKGLEQQSAQRGSGPAPTGGAGAGTRREMTLQQIDDMPMKEWDAIPADERRRLLDSAHAKAAR